MDWQSQLSTCQDSAYMILSKNRAKEMCLKDYLNPRDPADGGNAIMAHFQFAYDDRIKDTANGLNKGRVIEEITKYLKTSLKF